MKERLLLVDDDQNVRESIARVLLLENYRVLLAADGNEAMKIAATYPIDLVLLDLNMPGKSGWDTFIELANQFSHIPVIIITARPNQSFTSMAAGVDALMEKPLDFSKLLQTIRGLLTESPELRQARKMGQPGGFHHVPALPREQAREPQ